MKVFELKLERKEAYVEVLEVLKHMEHKYMEKIPKKLIEFFKSNASKEYKFKLDNNIPFEEQQLKKSTISILAMLNYNYWCEDEEHKKYLLNKYNENEIKYQEMLMEKYSVDKLFNKENVNFIQENKISVPQKYEEMKWYEKIFEFIKRIFNK